MRSVEALSFAFALSLAAVGCVPIIDPGPDPGVPEECTDASTPGCFVASNRQRITSPDVPDADLKAAVSGNTAFALDLYQQLRTENGNLFYSPFSISEALAMTFAGARGETEKQMAAALHFDLPQAQLHPAFNSIDLALASRGKGASGSDGAGFRLNVSNALWGQTGYPFEAPFLDTLALSYGSGMHVVDFIGAADGSRTIINDWVADRTENRIKDLLPQGTITSDTRLVLTNTIYFNAAWAIPFDPSSTKLAPFTHRDGSKSDVQTMAANQDLSYGAGDDYAAVALPYENGELSMLLILPPQGSLDAFEASLTPARLTGIVDGMSGYNVSMTMPRFKIESSFSLGEQLAKLGMIDAFTESADFSGVNGKKDLSISAVVHKAFVNVSETGTEAAAATAVVAGITSLPPAAEIHLDHPYLFLIRDNATGSILFLGRVEDPST